MSTGHRTDVPRPAGERTGPIVIINDTSYLTVRDAAGTQRFPVNRIVRDVNDAARTGEAIDMNHIWIRHYSGHYTLDEVREFYRLIGYSISGYSEIFEEDVIDNPLWEKRSAPPTRGDGA